MRLIATDTDKEYVLEFENANEYQEFFDRAQQDGFFLLSAPDLTGTPIFRARCLGSPRSRKITPCGVKKQQDGSYRVELTDSPPVSEPQPAPSRAETESAADAADDKTMYERIRAMPVHEKVTFAMRADFLERRILMQENNLKVNEFLLRNPRSSEQEIAWLARNPTVPMQTLLAIVKHDTWMKLPSVKSAALLNPRSPAPIVMEMIPTATSADVIKLYSSRELREDIKTVVVREIKKRGLRPKKLMD